MLCEFREVNNDMYGRLRLPMDVVTRLGDGVSRMSRDEILNVLEGVFGQDISADDIAEMRRVLGDMDGVYPDGSVIRSYVGSSGYRCVSYDVEGCSGVMDEETFVINCFLFCIDKDTLDLWRRFCQADEFFTEYVVRFDEPLWADESRVY